MNFDREDIRKDIEKSLRFVDGIKSVHSYRFKAFEPHDTPVINILPMTDEFDDTEQKVGFRRSEIFRIELLIARKQDDEDFAATCDRLYELTRRNIMGIRPCKANCSKVTIIRKSWAVDSDGQVPLVVVKFTVRVEFDESD